MSTDFNTNIALGNEFTILKGRIEVHIESWKGEVSFKHGHEMLIKEKCISKKEKVSFEASFTGTGVKPR